MSGPPRRSTIAGQQPNAPVYPGMYPGQMMGHSPVHDPRSAPYPIRPYAAQLGMGMDGPELVHALAQYSSTGAATLNMKGLEAQSRMRSELWSDKWTFWLEGLAGIRREVSREYENDVDMIESWAKEIPSSGTMKWGSSSVTSKGTYSGFSSIRKHSEKLLNAALLAL